MTAVLFVLLALSAFGFWQFSRSQYGVTFLLYLLAGLVPLLLIPLILYRLYSIYRARYHVERDGITLQWGLRAEVIPMDKIEWIHPISELDGKLPLPRIRWPGALIGVRRLADGTQVEFLAGSLDGLVLISLGDRYFAVSPADPAGFVAAYQKYTELGSLAPLQPLSVYPSFLLARFWRERLARALFLAGLGLCVILLAWVILIIPSRAEVPLRLDPSGAALDMVPSVRLLLLPVLAAVIFAVDFLAGLFFYRSPDGRPTAFLFWLAGMLTPVLFLVAVGFIQRAS